MFPASLPRWRATCADIPRKRLCLAGIELFDLFPQTFHIETLALLESRKNETSRIVAGGHVRGGELRSGDFPCVHAGWCFLFAAAGIAAGLVFAWRKRLFPRAGVRIFEHGWRWAPPQSRWKKPAVPAKAVAKLSRRRRLDLSSPHHWTGRLRADPLRLPWGERLEIELESVESEGSSLPVRGGLQISFFHRQIVLLLRLWRRYAREIALRFSLPRASRAISSIPALLISADICRARELI